MSATTAPTDPNALLFPAFVYGTHTMCRRKLNAEAQKWVKRFDNGKDFPEPKLIPVPPGSLMICDGAEAGMVALGAGGHDKSHWFFYFVDALRMEASVKTFASSNIFLPVFEAFACRYPWGALSLATNFQTFNTIELVSRRIEAVLSFWEPLDTLQYLRHRRYTLGGLMRLFHEGIIRTWIDSPSGSVKELLPVAIGKMRKASEDEIHGRIVRRLHEFADTDPEVKHREWLKSPGVIEAGLAHDKVTSPGQGEDMKIGDSYILAGFLHSLDKKYPGGAQ